MPSGRIIIELRPGFAPLHVANIKTLVRARYFDGLPVLRVQENYVAQWGDPDNRHPIPPALMSFYLEEAGFGGIVVERLSPAIESMPSLAELPEAMRKEFFGALDYAVFARKLAL